MTVRARTSAGRASVVRHQLVILFACLVVSGTACVYDMQLDCTPKPIDLAAGPSPYSGGIVLASSCHRLVIANGVTYMVGGPYPLLDGTIDRLEPYGAISHANDAAAYLFASPPDLVVWAIAGMDPGRALWGTGSEWRGTNTYSLLVVADCEGDACEPPFCELIDLSNADDAARERCGAEQT